MAEEKVDNDNPPCQGNMIPMAALESMLREKGKRAYSHEVMQMATELMWRRRKDDAAPVGEDFLGTLKAFEEEINVSPGKLTPLQKDWCLRVADALHNHIEWSYTLEGHKFWYYVWTRLKKNEKS